MTDGGRPDDVLAGEYVLGVLEGAERATFEHRLARDRALQVAVARWREHLSPLDATAAPVAPAAALWSRIESSVGRRGEVEEKSSLFDRLWSSLMFWRGASFAGAAAGLVLALVLALAAGRSTPQPLLVAVLQAGDASPGAIVEIAHDGRISVVPLKDFEVPVGRALQVWTLWDQARGPVSVGLIERPRRASFQRADLPARDNQLYEITLEPAGGSPTGRPTGPVLGKGYAAIPRL
jgi:anti-sigma-K factor RskA